MSMWDTVLAILIVVFLLLVSIAPHVHALNCETQISNVRIEQAVEVAGRAYGVDPCLVAAVIKAESDFQSRAVSPRGAEGLMQLMPDTAAILGVDDSFNIEWNIAGGTRYLNQMYAQFGTWRRALIAYNWGPGNLLKYGEDRMPEETQTYLLRVERFYGNTIK